MSNVLLDVSKARRAIDKKARRKASRMDRMDGKGIEGVITTGTAQLREVRTRDLDMNALYVRARRDMGLRTDLTLRGRTDPGAAKRRRQLNNWELDTKPAGASDAWLPEQTRRAVGKCDVDAVSKKIKLKHNGAY